MRDPITHLRIETGLTDFSVIYWPEPEPGLAKRRLSEALLSRDVPKLAEKAGHQLKFTHPLGSEASSYLDAITESTVPISPSSERANLYIDWSVEEAATLLTKF